MIYKQNIISKTCTNGKLCIVFIFRFRYNIVFPCMMMSTLTVLVFCLPPDSGEKIALGVTVLLAFSVFMLAIAEKMPETSESIPLIGKFLLNLFIKQIEHMNFNYMHFIAN